MVLRPAISWGTGMVTTFADPSFSSPAEYSDLRLQLCDSLSQHGLTASATDSEVLTALSVELLPGNTARYRHLRGGDGIADPERAYRWFRADLNEIVSGYADGASLTPGLKEILNQGLNEPSHILDEYMGLRSNLREVLAGLGVTINPGGNDRQILDGLRGRLLDAESALALGPLEGGDRVKDGNIVEAYRACRNDVERLVIFCEERCPGNLRALGQLRACLEFNLPAPNLCAPEWKTEALTGS